MSENRVTTAELIKNFGQLADQALTEPVTITKHGRDRLVMLSVEEYQRLKRRDRQVYRVEDLPEEWVEAIAKSEPGPDSVAAQTDLDRNGR
ncbi:MAG: type II toxin-antitoxin system Phd/YefM family antitoxin [Hyphomicrobium zavarzinii]|uniref:type II toxin-antitoxin system Phd/YefM family antitoxin n=1 Tax=Hyphomicrobium zavarzinii TaxID=48292 RepID=UPI001A4D4414|nr:type II toxin-antitoxin system Phd/YefM family antitoxin [Hyphomicrobium zavarzinii]MBL8845206.1 type II toxin-antitoxin system Phd/YefM family antitoxin [Hyphomicrobium zavarzinii]